MAEFRGRPAYVHIADDVRRQILDGALQADDRLPSESELMADYGVSRIVVRHAVEILRSEGLVVKHQGRGSFVRAQRPARKRVLGDFYGERPEASPFATSAATMRTNYRFFADGEPVMLSTSFEALTLTEDTPIEQPEGSPVTGVVPRMDSIGIHVTHVAGDVTGRAARPYEAETLNVPVGVPVLVIERTYFADGRPVETAEITVSSDRYVLSYRLPVPSRES